MEDLTAKVAVHDQQIKSLEARTKKLEDMREGISEIKVAIERQTGNIDRLAEIVGGIGKRQEEHESRLDAIEQKPGEKWDKVAWQVLSIVIAAVVGMALAHIGL